ncbi:3-hydroxyacyl-CoA dehydrogenase [Amylibacter marinus]|uniref:3-hydroxyacyl-CoA dehydrogenase n=1 Tax=Amylibacter marinus TaxID=1475483 RepID=A0ABQ5VV88_9RHOB|nr:3-hydroxyacyl-CoA dehydrogenase NAD-binding domain-containing protein [Amylibacter marinus]GLQ35148.1 3-hydroxyacyl-CoA dehydrogenase [Amylibacter marinus]
MTEPVTLIVQGDIAIVRLDNPPVNATSTKLRAGLLDAVEKIGEMNVRVAILYCVGKTFVAGGDMSEFNAPPVEPHLPDVVQAIEDSPVPFIAALHGTVLGGGFEIAMGCAFRVALGKTRFGLPEVHVGLVPGAGGTQRLPRLIGLGPALGMITSGGLKTAEEMLALGGIDQISTAEGPLAAGLEFASDLPSRPTAISQRPCPTIDAKELEAMRSTLEKRAKGQQSPLHCLEITLRAEREPFAVGQPAERALHLNLRDSAESRALRHVFFAERAVSRPALLQDATPMDIHKVAVVGGGLMGAGIAFACLNAGFSVILLEQTNEATKAGVTRIDKLISGGVERGKVSADRAQKMRDALSASTDYAKAAPADLAIEAVFEDLAVKQAVFHKLAQHMRTDAILATNTSYLDPELIMAGIENPSRCIGLHFFSPAHIMKLLEIVHLPETSATTLATGFDLGKRLRKVAALSGVCDGFIGNRILAAYRREADYLLMDGAKPSEIDVAMRAFGMPMGPYELQDLTGLQIAWANRKRQAPNRPPSERYVSIGDKLCEAGRTGQRAGAGWYRYEDGARTPIPDPYVEDLLTSQGAGTARFSAEDIVNRILAAIINEGARIVEEGIAERPLDVDMVMIHGYGFPRWRGGPMAYAREKGIDQIREHMADVAAQSPNSWIISKMLA